MKVLTRCNEVATDIVGTAIPVIEGVVYSALVTAGVATRLGARSLGAITKRVSPYCVRRGISDSEHFADAAIAAFQKSNYKSRFQEHIKEVNARLYPLDMSDIQGVNK